MPNIGLLFTTKPTNLGSAQHPPTAFCCGFSGSAAHRHGLSRKTRVSASSAAATWASTRVWRMRIGAPLSVTFTINLTCLGCGELHQGVFFEVLVFRLLDGLGMFRGVLHIWLLRFLWCKLTSLSCFFWHGLCHSGPVPDSPFE